MLLISLIFIISNITKKLNENEIIIFAIGLTIGILIWILVGVFIWIKGKKKKSTIMIFIGSFMALDVIGLIIALLQKMLWDKRTWDEEQKKKRKKMLNEFEEEMKKNKKT